jgi:phosphate:Na+ symporter
LIFATVGFKLNIESYSLPVIAVTATAMFFLQRQKKIYNLLRLFFAIALLFLGIGFMKSGADKLVGNFDLGTYTHYHTFVFVLVGFILTTIIQSSSATVAIILTALHANAITFEVALAIVIGSELGTTIKIVLAAAKGSPDKKRVAWGNFAFNATTTTIAYTVLPWFIFFIQTILKIQDPLVGLVFFQSAINFLSIILFLPIINPFARWLERRFTKDVQFETSLISTAIPVVPAIAVDAVYHETEKLLNRIAEYHRLLLAIDAEDEGFFHSLTKASGMAEESYEKLKKIEGEILLYCSTLPAEELEPDQHKKINQYFEAVRHAIHSAKSLKDIQHNIKDLMNTGDDTLHIHYQLLQQDWKEFQNTFARLLSIEEQKYLFEELTRAMKTAFDAHHKNNKEIISALKKKHFDEVYTSTLMNVQLEVLSAKKSLFRALAHLKLDEKQANAFEFLPGY